MKKDLLSIVVCPKCKGRLKMTKGKLDCENCRLIFSFIDKDIPKMLLDDAEKY